MPQFDGIKLIVEDGFSKDEAVTVTMGSRSMINFVERRLSAIKSESEITDLNIVVSKSSVDDDLIRYKRPKGHAGIRTRMDPRHFINPPAKFHKTCAEMIRKGFRAASRHTELPVDQVSQAIDDFIEGGFVNRWTHADKTWQRTGIRSVIRCDLRTDAFELTQSVYRDQKLLTEAIIARTKPREWLFYPLLGKLSLSKSQIFYRTGNKLLSSYDLETEKLDFPSENIKDAFKLDSAKAE